ncbi:hypothetical protein D3C74_476110 [compost metagenome]
MISENTYHHERSVEEGPDEGGSYAEERELYRYRQLNLRCSSYPYCVFLYDPGLL